jgi:hypothetical protein
MYFSALATYFALKSHRRTAMRPDGLEHMLQLGTEVVVPLKNTEKMF